jgi:uncharacterized Zn finger protein (UPF0148 family)
MTEKRGPRCPNHGVPLVLTNEPGLGICPISDCRFRYVPLEDQEKSKPEFENVIENGKIVTREVKKFKIIEGSEDGHDYNVR